MLLFQHRKHGIHIFISLSAKLNIMTNIRGHWVLTRSMHVMLYNLAVLIYSTSDSQIMTVHCIVKGKLLKTGLQMQARFYYS